jgi:hypothetical protein
LHAAGIVGQLTAAKSTLTDVALHDLIDRGRQLRVIRLFIDFVKFQMLLENGERLEQIFAGLRLVLLVVFLEFRRLIADFSLGVNGEVFTSGFSSRFHGFE